MKADSYMSLNEGLSGKFRKISWGAFKSSITYGCHAFFACLLWAYFSKQEGLVNFLVGLRESKYSWVLLLIILVLGASASLKIKVISYLCCDIRKSVNAPRTIPQKLIRYASILKGFVDFSEALLRSCWKPLRTINKSILTAYLVVFLCIPLATDSKADARQDYEELSQAISSLTAFDFSIGMLKWGIGSTLTEIQRSPLFPGFIFNSGLPAPITDGNLNTEVFEGFKPVEINDLTSNVQSNIYPDAPLGFLSWALGNFLLLIMLVAAVYRVYFTMLIEGVSMGNDPNIVHAVIKKMLIVCSSGAFSYILAAPIYKGYAIITLFMLNILVCCIGLTNYSLMQFMQWQTIGVSSPAAANPKADKIFDAVMQMTLCNASSEKSTGEARTTKLLPSKFGQLDFKIEYSACGTLEIKSQGAQNWSRSSASSSIDKYVAKLSPRNQEVQREIMNYSRDEYFKALSVLIDRASKIVSDISVLQDDSSVGNFIKACEGYRASGYTEIKDLTDLGKSNCQKPSKDIATGASSISSIQGEMVQARDEFSASIKRITTSAFQMAQNKLKLVTEDGQTKLVKTESALDYNNPDTYGVYKMGWVGFPYYDAISRWANKRTLDFLNMDVEQETDIKESVNKYAIADMYAFMSLYQYLNNMSYESEALTDTKSALDTADGIVKGTDLDVKTFSNADGVVSDYIATALASMFLSDGSENIIDRYADAGQTILGAYIVSKTVFGAISEYVPGMSLDDKGEDGKKGKSVNSALTKLVDQFGGSSIAKFIPGGGLVYGAVKGAISAYTDMIGPLFKYALTFAIVCAYGLPSLVILMFWMCVLKWILQVIKAAIFNSLAVVKIYSGEGVDIFSPQAREVFMSPISVAIGPILIVFLFCIVNAMITPIVAGYQVITYVSIKLIFSDTLQGPLYIVFLLTMLVVPPLIGIFYMYSLPSMAQDSVMQYLSLNLGIGNSSAGYSGFSSAFGAASRLTGNRTTVPPPATPPPARSTTVTPTVLSPNSIASNSTGGSAAVKQGGVL